MSNDVWILGGAGRFGRVIAAELRKRTISPVLVGRNADRLATAAHDDDRTLVTPSMSDIIAEIRRQKPAVVINTIAPFAETAGPIMDAGSHYIDLSNDAKGVVALLARDNERAAAGRTAVTGAGFGMAGTESALVNLLEDQPTPDRVRVDMIPSLDVEAGTVGESLATSIFEGLTYREPGLARLASSPTRLMLPDGTAVTTASMPQGDLIAARRASGAREVVAASSQAPSGLMRAALPLLAAAISIPPVRAALQRRFARVTVKAAPRPREYSWAHARAEWTDGTTRENWLRVRDASTFTGAVPAEIARRLLDGAGRPGAFTPVALFGPSLAEACGAEFMPGLVPA
ncbi:hypothetical protein [Microbacterium sp. MPKO10]|uniref:hypothetical protein n=1 Tax=Microbacterium sp. MPKO10 TaxID=2989818 RepID=UPI0022356541|nr:hypothetical protein [Microbacterium sp. MPKO10]MCW4457664.1 hypothetical protein [Microbacterium sp. MPKO10]